MAEKNPKIVVESITDDVDAAISKSINVYPVTISKYAWLELIDSPFIDTEIQFGVNNIVPTAYVMCSTPAQLKKYTSRDVEQLKQDAGDWADANLKLEDIPDLIKAIVGQMQKLNKAAPENVSNSGSVDDGSKKK